MIVLGVLLLVLAALVVVAAVAKAHDPTTFDLGVVDLHTSVLFVFLAGALTLLVAVVGLSLISSGLKRAARRRKEVKELRQQADATPASRDDGDDSSAETSAASAESRSEQTQVQRTAVADEPAQESSRLHDPLIAERSPAQPVDPASQQPATRGTDEGPDEHFESAPRER